MMPAEGFRRTSSPMCNFSSLNLLVSNASCTSSVDLGVLHTGRMDDLENDLEHESVVEKPKCLPCAATLLLNRFSLILVG